MSYVRIIVYSFECDRPGCGALLGDVIPTYPPTLRKALALAELENQDWSFGARGEALCPDHPETLRTGT